MSGSLLKLRRRWPGLTRLLRDRSGAAAVTIAFALTGIIGMAGLATEVSNWYLTSRRMQSAADAAAFSAATGLAAGESKTNVTSEATYVAGSTGYGFVTGTSGVTVTVNNPPASGSHTSDNKAVEVLISQPQTPMLSGLFLSSGPTITARAVATAAINGTGCVLALNRGDVTDVTDSGNTTINLNNCAMYVNSDDPTGALTMNGNVTINAGGVYVTGGISQGQGTINDNGNTHTGAAPLNDPYANLSVPSYSGCNSLTTGGGGFQNTNGTGTTNVPANANGVTVFCGGLDIEGGTVNLPAGVVIINGGQLKVGGNGTLNGDTTGSGTTIILTGPAGNIATAKFDGGASVNLVAPTSGAFDGIAIFQDRNAPTTGSDTLTGGSSQDITGAIYFPSQQLQFKGNSTSGGSACTQLVAYELTFTGTSTFNNNCSTAGTTQFGSASATMVE